MRIALAGNPNTGKTTLYNALTGAGEKVGNWAGVTVDKKERAVRRAYTGGRSVSVVDLPGTYSLTPFTGEESITSRYIKEEAPDVIVNIVDATNLRRGLFFTTQLLELGIPVVVALNKSDMTEKEHTAIDRELLAAGLYCPVIPTAANTGRGLSQLIEAAMSRKGQTQTPPYRDSEERHTSGKNTTDKRLAEEADRRRFVFVDRLLDSAESKAKSSADRNIHDKIDAIITHKWLGIPIFAAMMLLVFQISQVWIGEPIAALLVGLLEGVQETAGELLANANPLLSALLVDGVIGGVAAVVGFLPLVMVMYFLIALLEDCGYMSRVAVVMDPLFKRVGLSGKSVIPFVMTVGCAVPGIMASRTIRDERERRATAMLAPFMPCGAKIPVIALFAGAFFDNAGWVSALMYFSGILLIFIGAYLVKCITGVTRKMSYFIMELPPYKAPSLFGAFRSMCDRGWAYIVKAATVILLCNMAVGVMQSFRFDLGVAETPAESILAGIASPIAYVLFPIVGVLSWQLAAAAVTGLVAKENVVGTLAVCFAGLENLIDPEELSLLEGAGADVAGMMAITKVAALAYLMFNLFTPPCFAAIGAMNAEMKSRRWLFGGLALQFGVGFTVSYLIYTVGTLLTAPASLHIGGAAAGLVAVLAMLTALAILIRRRARVNTALPNT